MPKQKQTGQPGYYNVKQEGPTSRRTPPGLTLVGPFETEEEAVINYAVGIPQRDFQKEIAPLKGHVKTRLPIPSYYGDSTELLDLVENPDDFSWVRIRAPESRVHKSWKSMLGGATDRETVKWVHQWLYPEG